MIAFLHVERFSIGCWIREVKPVTTPHGSSQGLLGVRQAVSFPCHHMQTGVEVAVDGEAAIGIVKGPIRQREV